MQDTFTSAPEVLLVPWLLRLDAPKPLLSVAWLEYHNNMRQLEDPGPRRWHEPKEILDLYGILLCGAPI